MIQNASLFREAFLHLLYIFTSKRPTVIVDIKKKTL